MTRVAAEGEPRFSTIGRTTWARGTLDTVLTLFLLSCVFDPADLLLGLKAPLFLLAWMLTIVRAPLMLDPPTLPISLLIYILLFVTVPILSIVRYVMAEAPIELEGLNLLKGYLLISLAGLLVLNRIDLMPRLAIVLNVLATTIVGTYCTLYFMPDYYQVFKTIGDNTGIFILDNRDYGNDISLLQVYYVTSPMLVMTIAWYAQSARYATKHKERVWYLAMILLNMMAMIIAGSRNNIFAAIALPLFIWFMYARNKLLNGSAVVGLVSSLMIVFFDEIQAFLNAGELSNSIKIGFLADYSRIFADPWVIIFGQGLGASEFFSAKEKYLYITELTYLEMLRNFGLLGMLLMLALLMLPIRMVLLKRCKDERILGIGYGFYLLMCFSNPNLFSSMGILILCVLLARMYQNATLVTARGTAP